MVKWMSAWAEQIIVAVIIAGIIEMILPNGNNKKYIKAVLGVYILFTIISPIIGKFTNFDFKDIDYEKYFKENETYQTMSESLTTYNDKSIEEIYITNLKQDMRSKLKDKGYIVEDIDISIIANNLDYGKIDKILLNLRKKNEDDLEKNSQNSIKVSKVENIEIENTHKSEAKINIKEVLDKDEIKEYISSVYDIKKENIKINE